jgi:membrane protease subunit (stomatin/prohibitin family)
MTSPLRAEVYFVNLKIFPNLTWGTRDPVAFRDAELGLIRLRAFGVFNIRILQPVLFINSLVGTQGVYTTEEVSDYLNRVIVSRFNDFMGDRIDTILNLPARYNELAEGLIKALEQDFSQFGLGLSSLYINAITPPPEVQKAIDDKSRLGVFDDLNKLLKMKAAMAMEAAASNQGEAGAGMGMGMGFMMPAFFAEAFRGGSAPQGNGTGPSPSSPSAGGLCPACSQPVPREARFCPACGQQIVVIQRCTQCGEVLPANARFCTACGRPTEDKPSPRFCGQCGTENLANAVFCNQCGERL